MGSEMCIRDSSYIDEHGHEKLVTGVAAEGLAATPKKSSTVKTRKRSGTTGTKSSALSGQTDGHGYAGLPPPRMPRMDTTKLGLTQLSQLPPLPAMDDTDIGGPPLQRSFSHASSSIINPRPSITQAISFHLSPDLGLNQHCSRRLLECKPSLRSHIVHQLGIAATSFHRQVAIVKRLLSTHCPNS